jgi:hypothetical protein
MYILCRIFKTENCINVTVVYKNFSSSTTFAFYCNGLALISEIVSVGFSPVTAFRCMPVPSFSLSLSLSLPLSFFGGGGDGIWRATLSQTVERLAKGWTTEESGFDSRQEQENFLFCITSVPALGPTHPTIQWIAVDDSRGGGGGGKAH